MAENAENVYVGEPPRHAALDTPLGKLLENKAAAAALKPVFGSLLDSPRLSSMQNISRGKLLNMGGKSLPPQALDALERSLH